MERTLICEIVTPERKIFSGEGTFVVVPTSTGELGILPLHVPLVSTLAFGEIRVTIEGKDEPKRFAAAGGYVQVFQDKVIVLADAAVAVEDIDVTAARERIAELEERRSEVEKGSGEADQIDFEVNWNRALLHTAHVE